MGRKRRWGRHIQAGEVEFCPYPHRSEPGPCRWEVLPDGRVEVETALGPVRGRKLILTAGAWMHKLVPELKAPQPYLPCPSAPSPPCVVSGGAEALWESLHPSLPRECPAVPSPRSLSRRCNQLPPTSLSQSLPRRPLSFTKALPASSFSLRP